ncbi:hypothetical protein ACWEKM_33770 [Streptomyces sp. NPDC004752]
MTAAAAYRDGTGTPEPEPGSGPDLRTVATVSGEPVAVAELRARMVVHRAEVAARFPGDPNAPGFWTRPATVETPLGTLRRQALDELIGIKVQQVLAREAGILTEIGYPTFLRRLQEENEQRRRHVACHEPIFGPKQYTEQSYFSYLFDRMVLDLRAAYATGRLSPTEPQLRACYDRIRDTRFRLAGSGHRAFDEVRSAVLVLCVEEAYAALVEERIHAAVVVPDADVLNAVGLE